MPFPAARPSLLCAFAFTALVGCTSAPRIAGTVPVPAGATRTLRLTTPSLQQLRLHLWNRSGSDVTWRRLDPPPHELAQGVLTARNGDHVWSATAQRLVVELLGGGSDAVVGYEARSETGLQVDVDHTGTWRLP